MQITSDGSLADNFDAPWIEPVKLADGTTADLKFARPDMEYWAQWAEALREKNRRKDEETLSRIPGMDPMIRARAMAEIHRRDVQIYAVLDQQFTPRGIAKILDDALARGGMTNADERRAKLSRIPPNRQQEIAALVCSEPRSTIEQLREAAMKLAQKLGVSPTEMVKWDDAQIIQWMEQYQPPPPEVEEDGQNPTEPGAGGPGTGSTSATVTQPSDGSSGSIPAS